MGRRLDEAWVRRQKLEEAATSRGYQKELAWLKNLTGQDASRRAEKQTQEAVAQFGELQTILQSALKNHNAVSWRTLKDESECSERAPPLESLHPIPSPPNPDNPKYRTKLGFADALFGSLKQQRFAESRRRFDQDMKGWQILHDTITIQNRDIEDRNRKKLAAWERKRRAFDSDKLRFNRWIDEKRSACKRKDAAAVKEYCQVVLSNSRYPDCCPHEFELEYNPDTGVLIVEYRLPSVDNIPRVKEVRYNKTNDGISLINHKDTEIEKVYDNLIYQIALRTLHELFAADTVNVISSIGFNGFVHSVDPATGKDVRPCIVSVHTKREPFLELNLNKVDPKACFKALKGVGSSKLATLTPVMPVVVMARDDRRFVAANDVIDTLDPSVNLAAMDWEDFEHLIREVFEQEFAQSGGEVKVTQASRDGGVDAIVFDPDPIRGGKLVIQAKRYTNTVPVSAVRDLYGTLMNEGATKGILVTTSDYGPDSYEFAKGKPITLLNGGNLLYLLEKHGHAAKIDIRAAKLEEKRKET